MAGTQGTIRLDDFVIPRDELRCSFVATSDHGLRDMDTWDGTKQDTVTVSTAEGGGGLVQAGSGGKGHGWWWQGWGVVKGEDFYLEL